MRNKKFYNFVIMSLHIGEEIKKVFDKSGMKVQAFADKINYSRQNVNGIFKRSSLDTDLLLKISNVLNHDFFTLYVKQENILNEHQEKYHTKSKKKYKVSIVISVDDDNTESDILQLVKGLI